MIFTLMMKTHNQTGLRYLCKTNCQDPHKYLGSGKYWKRHLRAHGRDVSTEILWQCEDIDQFEAVALHYSRLWNVVESEQWANLKEENGKDGGVTHRDPFWLRGFRHTDESKKKIGDAARGKSTPGFRGMTHTPEARAKIAEARREYWQQRRSSGRA